MNTEPIYCAWCGNLCPSPTDFGASGYAITRDDKKICYDCAGWLDGETMEATGRACMYWSQIEPGQWRVVNWPATLVIQPHTVRHSKGRGFGGPYSRVDVWFRFRGHEWHGVHQGEHNTLLRCKRKTK